VSTAAHHDTGCASAQLLCMGSEEVCESIYGDFIKQMYEAACGMV
jgi:hypothetical protein